MTVSFRRYWPIGATDLLLKAAFHSDMRIAAQAWRSWYETCDLDNSLWNDLRIASHAHRRLSGLENAGPLEPRLLGLRRYIWSGGRMRIDAATPLMKELVDKKVPFMPIKGSVLLARDPQVMADRFIGDIDILIDLGNWERAVAIAFDQGWKPAWIPDREAAIHRMRQTHHALDLQRGVHGAVDLHQFSLALNRQLGADVMLWKRAGQGTLGGIPVLLPHPSDQLAIIFGHCFLYANPRSFDWVADALATISAPGFDWSLFTDVVLDRELAVPAAAALTYMSEELQCSIPVTVMEHIVEQLREPFLSEFAASHRTYVSDVASECRAIYQAECIRSRRFVERASIRHDVAARRNRVNATLTAIKAGEKIVLALPSGVRPMDSIQFRLRFEVADEWRRTFAFLSRKSPVVVLRCFDYISIELGRLRIRRSGPHELIGEIDGALVAGRGIDQLSLVATNVDAFWFRKARNLRSFISRVVGKRPRGAELLRKLQDFRTRLRSTNKGSGSADGGTEPPVALLGGAFEATISTSTVDFEFARSARASA